MPRPVWHIQEASDARVDYLLDTLESITNTDWGTVSILSDSCWFKSDGHLVLVYNGKEIWSLGHGLNIKLDFHDHRQVYEVLNGIIDLNRSKMGE